MLKQTFAQKLLCLVWVLIGSILTGIGIVLVLQSGIGVDPLTLLEEGMSYTFHIPSGTAVLIVNMTTLTLGFLLNRRSLGWGSVLCSVAIGPAVNAFAAIFPVFPSTIWGGLLMNVIGVAVMGLGIACYMLPEYGVGGMESIMMFFSEKFHCSYAVVRICMDALCAIGGLLLGGSLGIGLVIGVFGLGIAINFFLRVLQKIFLPARSQEA